MSTDITPFEMNTGSILRSLTVDEIHVERTDEGRTIIARALTFGQPYKVTDDGGRTFYNEVWNRSVFNRSMAHRGAAGKVPLMTLHNRMRLPIGAVQQIEDVAGLMTFVAKVSRTRDGDEALELVNDGVLTGVSIGAHVLANRPLANGAGVERMEARLEEISLAPMQFTQMPDAAVLAVRAVLANADGSDGVDGPATPATPTLDEARAILSKFTTRP